MSQGAKEILVASFVNMSSVVERAAASEKESFTVVCAGESGRFSLEDAVCAGMLIERLGEKVDIELNDGSDAARCLYRQNKDSVSDLLKECEHGRYLASLGFSKDLDICSRVDSLSILPVVKEGRIVKPKRTRRK
jgi:2-phosphosulfolactate phosphatase